MSLGIRPSHFNACYFAWFCLTWVATTTTMTFVKAANLVTSSSSFSSSCSIRTRPAPDGDSKTLYRIGILANRGVETVYKEWNATADYLTQTVGKLFTPNLQFEASPVVFDDHVLDAYASPDSPYDFVFANPTISSCVASEVGAESLVTLISQRNVGGQVYQLTQFGGVVIALATNTAVRTIADIRDQRVGVISISGLGSGQMQFRELVKAGLHHLQDPKQLIFMQSQGAIVNAVLRGQIDVGFIRTDQLERTIDDNTGALVDRSLVKIIGAMEGLKTDDGQIFPFVASTPLYPEWNVASLAHVPPILSEVVQANLLRLDERANLGKALQDCLDKYGCNFQPEGCYEQCYQLIQSDMQANGFPSAATIASMDCLTNPAVALAARKATVQGKYAGWRTSASYMSIRNMQEEVGFIRFDESTNSVRCNRGSELSDAVVCPAGHFQKSSADIENGCANVGLDCYGFTCLCKPCVKAFDVDFMPWKSQRGQDSSMLISQEAFTQDGRGCDKFAFCGSVEQGGTLTFRAVDNKKRTGIVFSVHLLAGDEETEHPMVQIDDFVYEYSFEATGRSVGSMIVEVFAGEGNVIPESPFRFEIIPRDCALDTGDDLREPNDQGECVCENQSVEIFGECVLLRVLIPCILGPSLLILAILTAVYVEYKKRQADLIWKVQPEELIFDVPPVRLGEGSFGIVLLGHYRGTTVAVKRATPPEDGKKPRYSPNASTDTTHLQHHLDGESHSLTSSNADHSDVEHGEGASNSSSNHRTNTDASGSGANIVDDYGLQSGRYSFDLTPRGVGGNGSPRRSSEVGWSSSRRSSGSNPSSGRRRLFSMWANSSSRFKEEFVKEMRHLSQLRHPCITTVMGAVVGNNRDPMLVMEYMDLGSLYDVLHNDNMILEGDIVIPIVKDIASGLRFLHSATPVIVHGDLKSKNILVDSQFRAKVSDFGLSSHLGSRRGRATGTPYWMAPELLRGESKNTKESDMYSFGIVLYEVFSRKRPYEGCEPHQTLRLVADKTAHYRPPVPTSCPRDIAPLLKDCFLDDPSKRPTAESVHELLKSRRSESANRTDSLLLELFPPNIASALRNGRKLEPEVHQSVTVYFSDIVGYTEIASSLSPTKLTDLLDRLYSKFDHLCDLHHVFKVETVGDAYMAVTNLVKEQPDHVALMARFALDAVETASGTLIDEEDTSKGSIKIRCGFHTGPVASHVVGSKNPRYSIIGDTVNIASRMESTSKAGRIQCTAKSAKLLAQQCPDIEVVRRGRQHIKGKGTMETFWVAATREEISESSDVVGEQQQNTQGVQNSSTSISATDATWNQNKTHRATSGDTGRLVAWNVELLKKYLERIVKYQSQSMMQSSSHTGADFDISFVDGTLLDEVKEVIMLPDFNARAIESMRNAETVELSSKVKDQLYEYVATIAHMYRNNPFHSFHHASHVIMSLDKLLNNVVSPHELNDVDAQRRDYTLHEYTYGISSDPLTQFACVFSALIHDVDHPGIPNAALVRENHRLATLYKNKSVAEQNSVALAWQLLMQPEFDALRQTIAYTHTEMARFRQLVINVVLATDIVDKELKMLRNNRWEVAFSETARLDDSPQEHMNRKATIVMEHLIQASDVVHTMQHWHIYRKWNERFFEECYDAFVQGHADSDPSKGWYKGELGFFDFYIIPLTKKLKECGVFGVASNELLNCAQRNRAEWEARGQEVVAEIMEKVNAKMKLKQGNSLAN